MAALTLFTSLVLCCVRSHICVSNCILVCVTVYGVDILVSLHLLTGVCACTVPCMSAQAFVCALDGAYAYGCVYAFSFSASSAVIVLLFAAMSISVIRANTHTHGNTCGIVAYAVAYAQLSSFHSWLIVSN